MATFDPTPIAVAVISAAGAVGAAYYAFSASRKTERKVKKLPQELVGEFSRLNPGVDTVEKVIELLYTEIGRLTKENVALRGKVDDLIAEKQVLLDEIRKMQTDLDTQKTKLRHLEARIQSSIPE